MALVDTTENWDDDFEFQSTTGRSGGGSGGGGGPLARDKANEIQVGLHQWTEPGPSTPSKTRHVEMETENWDDDFQDKSDSPIRRRSAMEASPRRVRRRRVDVEPVENWDDEFQVDDDEQRSATWDSSDEDVELGLHGSERDEDRTVTSRARYNGAFTSASSPGHTPPPPVPPLPHMFMSGGAHDPAPFPRSPSASVFSVPVSGRDSVTGHSYSSTAHLALRPTLSGSSLGHPLIPPSPPTQHSRERRRLRKKSRPAHVEPNIYELEDIPPAVPRSATPERERPTRRPEPTTPSSIPLDPDPPPVTPPSAGKSSLASRIGSVGKKWGASRKKRASIVLDASTSASASASASGHSRPQSIVLPSSPPVSKGAWFFRHGGTVNVQAESGSPPPPPPPPQNSYDYNHNHNSMTLPLRREKSGDRLLALIGDTPGRRRARVRQGLPSDLTHEQIGSGRSSPRRPCSMQFSSSGGVGGGSGGSGVGGRGQSTSRSRSSSVSRHPSASASASVDDVGHNLQYFFRTPRKGRSSAEHEHESMSMSTQGRGHATQGRGHATQGHEQESTSTSTQGYRTFMGSVRRLSLRSGSGHGHKAKQDSASSHGTSKDKARPSTSSTKTAVPMSMEFGNDTTPKPPSRVLRRPSLDVDKGKGREKGKERERERELLPPIELQPPSPPRIPSSKSEPTTTLTSMDALFEGLPKSVSAPYASTSTQSPQQHRSHSSSPHQNHQPHQHQPHQSQHSASLGRTTNPPESDLTTSTTTSSNAHGHVAPRRNSLGDLKISQAGDLKIPARISQAQIGLRRDLWVVREFAGSVGELRILQATHAALIADVQTMLRETAPPSHLPPHPPSAHLPHPPAPTHPHDQHEREHESKRRATSPMLFGLPRHGRARSSTNPQSSSLSSSSLSLAGPGGPSGRGMELSGPAMLHRQLSTTYRSIEARYAMTWECAELLVELGGGPVQDSGPNSNPGPGANSPNSNSPSGPRDSSSSSNLPHSSSSSPSNLPPHSSSDLPLSTSTSMEQSQSTITPSTHAHAQHEGRKGRERAVTLGGDEPKPYIPIISPSSTSTTPHSHSLYHSQAQSPEQWRASTGRHDLSHRQLLLLRDMLYTGGGGGGGGEHSREVSSSNGHGRGGMMESEEGVNRDWHWGEVDGGSVVTLPSEGSSHRDSILGQDQDGGGGGLKKRKGSRLGLRGLRDMLKSLRKTVSHVQVRSAPLLPVRLPEEAPPSPMPPQRVAASSTSIALTESSFGLPLTTAPLQERARRKKTSTEPEPEPESIRSPRDSHPNNPYMTSPSVGHHHTSPRRPSLASIFRLGHKSAKSSRSTSLSTSVVVHDTSIRDDHTASTCSCHTNSEIHMEEEEWDKVELSSELPVGADGMELPTLRGGKGKMKGKDNRSPRSMDLLLDGDGGPSTPAKAVANASRSSIWETSSQGPSSSLHSPSSASVSQSYLRGTKLSDVKEFVEKEGAGQRRHRRKLSKSRRHSALGLDPSPGRPMSRSGKKTVVTPVSVTSPPSALSSPSYHHLPDLGDVHTGFSDSPLSLAMTPENIRPLLENAKEVYVQCSDCIAELRQLLKMREVAAG